MKRRGVPRLPRSGLLFAAALFALAGCSQLGDYQRPEAPVPQAWPDAPARNRDQKPVAEIDWRSFYPDPRLQTLIEAALEHNRDLRIAVARVAEARAQYGVTSADILPGINLLASRTASGAPGELYGITKQITNQRYDFNTTVSYEVDFWGRVMGQSEAAMASFLASEEAQRSVRVSLIADVANAYFTTLETDERAAIAAATKETREQTRNLVIKAQQHGAASRLEVLQAEGATDSARSELAAIEHQRNAARNALQLLVGHAAGGTLPPGKSLENQEVFSEIGVGLPSEVLLARPDVMAAEQRLIAAHANIGAARAAFFPRILLTAGLGFASRTLNALFGVNSNSWNFSPSLSLPLFDAGRASSNVDLAQARKVVAIAEYEKTIQQAFREVADLLSLRETFTEQRRAMEANVKTQQERLEIAQTRFKAGIVSFMEVLDAQREYYAAQQAAVQMRRAQLSTAAQLYKALGGS